MKQLIDAYKATLLHYLTQEETLLDSTPWDDFLIFVLQNTLPYLHSVRASIENLQHAPIDPLTKPILVLDEIYTDPLLLLAYDCKISEERETPPYIPSLLNCLRKAIRKFKKAKR